MVGGTRRHFRPSRSETLQVPWFENPAITNPVASAGLLTTSVIHTVTVERSLGVVVGVIVSARGAQAPFPQASTQQGHAGWVHIEG